MRERIRGSIDEARWIDLQQGCTYTGLGRSTFKAWAKKHGAEVRIGRIVRYDKALLDAAMTETTKVKE